VFFYLLHSVCYLFFLFFFLLTAYSYIQLSAASVFIKFSSVFSLCVTGLQLMHLLISTGCTPLCYSEVCINLHLESYAEHSHNYHFQTKVKFYGDIVVKSVCIRTS